MSLFAVHVIRLSSDRSFQPGTKIPAGALTDKEAKRLLEKGAIREFSAPVAVEPPPTKNSETFDPALWAFEPKSLEGKSLEVLNMMIADHVAKHGLAAVEPFDSLEEALFWMSKDRK